ncbi:phosphatidylglycerophosphate synthase [Mycetocola sp. CAN_C7]|uniref:CDP-alcohol phosphatidyltransferase family protein n=1 Tax=Mycetocola sp. CAN_C7 TaxID=2787724 RepID=UPI0018CBE0B9
MNRYQVATAELASSQKSGAGVPAYLRWVNRGLGRRAAAVAYVAGLSPNAVTLISGMLSVGGMVVLVFLPMSALSAVAAMVLFLAGYALDSADGQLARLTNRGSIAGEWLDHVVDSLRLPLVHLAIALCLWRAGLPDWSVVVALLFLVLSSSWFFAQTLAGKLSAKAADDGSAAEGTPDWVSFAKIPYDVGTLYVVVAALAYPPLFLVLYTGLFVVTAAVAAASLRRKYRALLAEQRDYAPEN